MLTVVRQVVCSDREGGCVMLTVVWQVVCSDSEGGGLCDVDCCMASFV